MEKEPLGDAYSSYEALVKYNVDIDTELNSLGIKLQEKKEENETTLKLIKDKEKSIEHLNEKLKSLSIRESGLANNLETLRLMKVQLLSHVTDLKEKLRYIQNQREQSNLKHKEILNKYKAVYERHKATYESLPIVKEANATRIEIEKKRIQLMVYRKRIETDLTKRDLYNRIKSEKLQVAIIGFAKAMVQKRHLINEGAQLDELLTQTQIEIDCLEDKKNSIEREKEEVARNALSQILEKSEKTDLTTSNAEHVDLPTPFSPFIRIRERLGIREAPVVTSNAEKSHSAEHEPETATVPVETPPEEPASSTLTSDQNEPISLEVEDNAPPTSPASEKPKKKRTQKRVSEKREMRERKAKRIDVYQPVRSHTKKVQMWQEVQDETTKTDEAEPQPLQPVTVPVSPEQPELPKEPLGPPSVTTIEEAAKTRVNDVSVLDFVGFSKNDQTLGQSYFSTSSGFLGQSDLFSEMSVPKANAPAPCDFSSFFGAPASTSDANKKGSNNFFQLF